MKSIIKGILMACVLAVVTVGCGSKDAEIYPQEIKFPNAKATLESVSGKAGEHLQSAYSAIESMNITGALNSLIDSVSTKELSSEQMEAVMEIYSAISAYLAGTPENRTPEVITLEQKFTNVWNANYKG